MQTEFLAIICGLIAGIGWGFSGFFDAKAAKSIGPLCASVLINCFVAVGYAAIYLLFLRGDTFDALGALYAIASGIVITLGALTYFRGLAIGPVSLVSPLSAAYPLVTTVIAILAFQAFPSGIQLIAIGIIMCGIMAASGLIEQPKVGKRSLQKGPMLGLVTALSWGLGYALAAQGISRLGWQLASFIEFSAMALAFAAFIPLLFPGHGVTLAKLKSGLTHHAVLLAGSISLCAALALNIGLSQDTSAGAIVATLSACYPVLTVLLAKRSFNEQVAKLPLAGAAATIIGIIMLSASAS